MKKFLSVFVISSCLFIQRSFAQTERVPGPAERRITDSLCVAINRLDMSKVGTGKAAESAFMDCFMRQSALFEDVANERKVQMEDKTAMHQMGSDIAKNLLKMKCDGFMKLALKMADKSGAPSSETASGTLKRIDTKGFNYIVLTADDGKEMSFLWLRQFAGSEKFMNSGTVYTGKKVTINYQELEVYLPQAKGDYKVKEIVSLSVE